MNAAWFRYERTNGRYCPVVIYGEKPRVPKGEEDRITVSVPVPDDCLGPDGTPIFGRLKAKFPAPVVKADD